MDGLPCLAEGLLCLVEKRHPAEKITDTRNKDTQRTEIITEISQWLAVQKSVIPELDILAGCKPPQLI